MDSSRSAMSRVLSATSCDRSALGCAAETPWDPRHTTPNTNPHRVRRAGLARSGRFERMANSRNGNSHRGRNGSPYRALPHRSIGTIRCPFDSADSSLDVGGPREIRRHVICLFEYPTRGFNTYTIRQMPVPPGDQFHLNGCESNIPHSAADSGAGSPLRCNGPYIANPNGRRSLATFSVIWRTQARPLHRIISNGFIRSSVFPFHRSRTFSCVIKKSHHHREVSS